MLEKGIKTIDKEIRFYLQELQKNVINKVGADDLNKSLSFYGLKFKTGTSIVTVLKKLEEHRVRLDNHHSVRKIKGQLANLRTNEEKAEDK